MRWRGLIREYGEFLPVSKTTPVVSLLEGNTPLIEAGKLAKHIKFDGRVYLKFEGLNPTGSFKDRGMTVAVSKAIEEGCGAIVCASTGNTSASAAAYAAAAGIRCVVVLPHGKVAAGKLSQALIYGAEIVSVRGNFDKALEIARWLAKNYPFILVNSVNPYRIEGQKTASFEICEQLGASPDYHFIPVGNGGNITAYWKGYREYYYFRQRKTGRLSMDFFPPKMMGFQAAGAAPIVLGYPVENPETIASAIRIGNPASWKGAVEAAKNSGGKIDLVTDEEILSAHRLIARLEGIFCEPAAAASVAGLIKMQRAGFLEKAHNVVCTLTGNGLKDPDIARKTAKLPRAVEPDSKKIARILHL